MSLDTTTDALLKNIAAQNGPAIHEMDVASARAVFAQLVAALEGEKQPIHNSEDRSIDGPNGEIGLRIYTPRDAGASLLPVLVLYHGGGWVIGDLETHDNMCRYFANQADVIVVAVDYRLAPEHKFPAGINDCIAATEWVLAHAAELGADAGKLAVTGDSAGGNMAAIVAQQLKGKVAFQLLIYPVTDFSDAPYPSRTSFGTGEYFLSSADMAWFGALLTDDPAALRSPMGSPISGDLAGLAPALTVTAGFDLLRDEGKAYAEALKKAGVASEYKCYEGTIHGFASFPGALDAARDGLKFMAERLKAALA